MANGTYRLFVTKDGGDSWSELPSPPSEWKKGRKKRLSRKPAGREQFLDSPRLLPQRFNPFRKNLDLHGDLHAIEFAPYGSFVPSPSQIQIVFVAATAASPRAASILTAWSVGSL